MNDNRMYMRITLHGLVQGIGFRPYVVRLAKKWGIEGEVCNLGGAVRILASAPFCHSDPPGESAVLNGFLNDLTKNPPPLSEILHVKVEKGEPFPCGSDFKIAESGETSGDLVILPADLPVCDTCLSEMKDPNNRRYKHPLISCTLCGPRYSIIKKAPYDRCNTAMEVFDFCPECLKEYTSQDSRRFHAQTVSCNHCGPVLKFYDNGTGNEIRENEDALLKTVELLKKGMIVAVKGIGGYHFLADPYSDSAVKALRDIKEREQKPFAVCFPNLELIKSYARVSVSEESLLRSNARPIVLLEQKEQGDSKPFSSLVLQNSRYVGAFLPYTPILVRICDEMGPVIATSANLSDAPIINREEELGSFKNPMFAGILMHDRDIVVSQDDSVAWVIDGKPQVTRRARGYTPLPIYVSNFEGQIGKQVLAMGGELKSAFCLQKGPYAFVSQYLGDLGSLEAQRKYNENLAHMKYLLKSDPGIVACDLHPDYFTTRLAEDMGMPIVKVQHHHAHIASVMAEKGLIGPVLGVSFDGTGYGTDGTIWGGEFLVCEKGEFTRAAYLKAIPLLMGDDSMKDCQKTATSYLHNYGAYDAISDSRYPVIKGALEHNVNTILSSSMGRLFDAVSSMLNLCHWNRYEAEGAIVLEKAAYRALASKSRDPATDGLSFDIIERDDVLIMDPEQLVKSISGLMIKGSGKGNLIESLALGFHRAVCKGIIEILTRLKSRTGIHNAVLSGGVFQNKIITESLKKALEGQGFNVYIPSLVPANDGGISLGQAFIAMNKY